MFDFYKKRKIFFCISAAIIILGIVFAFINGIKLDIQFKGGAVLTYTYEGELDTAKVESIAKESFSRETSVLLTQDIATKTQKVVINLAGNEGVESEYVKNFEDALKAALPDNNLVYSETQVVDPFIGAQFFKNGMLAIGISSLLIILYIWYRFRRIASLSLGVMGLVALLHDCLIVLAVFIIFGIPLNDAYITVTMTIIGYSINDTIVIYDRIRENSRIMKAGTPIEVLVNKSINQSLTRSLITFGTTFCAVAAVVVFAVIYNLDSMVKFAVPLLVGLTAGCYSSIFIAGPLWTMWQKRKDKKQPVKAK